MMSWLFVDVPEDLVGRWRVTARGLAYYEWDLMISFGTYPPPACFDIARRYEAKDAEMQSKRTGLVRGKKPKKRLPPPKEQMELW